MFFDSIGAPPKLTGLYFTVGPALCFSVLVPSTRTIFDGDKDKVWHECHGTNQVECSVRNAKMVQDMGLKREDPEFPLCSLASRRLLAHTVGNPALWNFKTPTEVRYAGLIDLNEVRHLMNEVREIGLRSCP